MTTKKQRLLRLLADGEWHTNRELNKVCFAYSQRLGDLRKAEINSEHRCIDSENGLYEFRLLTPRRFINFEKCRRRKNA